jgi:hypothetical protein
LNLGTGLQQRPGFGGNSTLVVNGLAPASFGFTVDGTDTNGDPYDGSMGLYQNFQIVKGVSIEAVQEVQVAKDIFSAEVSGTFSGNVNLVTKGGTNELHGSLFENYQAAGLSARNQFVQSKAPLIFHQFGGSLGGPVIRNKLFYFGAFEGYRLNSQQLVNGLVPSAELRASANAAVPAYKPYFDLFPLPNVGASGPVTGFYQGIGLANSFDNHGVIRADWNISPSNLVNIRYTRFRPQQTIPRLVTENWRRWDGMIETGTVNFTHATSSWSSETRFGVNQNHFDRFDGLYTPAVVPVITGNLGFGGAAAGEFGGYGSRIFSIEDVVAVTRGRHSLKFGGIYKHPGIESVGGEQLPNYTYQSVEDLLANIPTSVNFTFRTPPSNLRWFEAGAFLQDDIRLSANLTVNVGLRYDYYAVPDTEGVQFFNRDGPFGPLRPQDQLYNPDYTNFSPRAGFAWKLDSEGRTVLRSGFGLFHTPHRMRPGVSQVTAPDPSTPSRVIFSRAEMLARNIRFPATNKDVLPLVQGTGTLVTGVNMNPNWPNAYSMQWVLGVQRQVTDTLALEISYVGNRALKMFYSRTINRVDRTTGLRPNPEFANVIYEDRSGFTRYHSLQTSLRKRFSRELSFEAYYTYANNMSLGNGDATIGGFEPQDPDNLRAEYARAPFDIRHRFVSSFLYELPLARHFGRNSSSRRLLLGGWQAGGIFTSETGLPITITQSSGIPGSRPDFVGRSFDNAIFSDNRTTLHYLNPAAFALVPVNRASAGTARPGTLGLYPLRAPGAWNIDLALSKNLQFSERTRLQLRMDLFNGLNHTSFSTVVTDINAANFGTFTGTRGARTMQLNARFSF